jgi:hypothetical protein
MWTTFDWLVSVGKYAECSPAFFCSFDHFQPRDLERTVLRNGQVNSFDQREMARIGRILRAAASTLSPAAMSARFP